MKYTEFLNECDRISKVYNLSNYKKDESETADAIRSKASKEALDLIKDLERTNKKGAKRSDAVKFEDRIEYAHTAFYKTGIYIHKQTKTRGSHSYKVSEKEYQKRQREAAPIEEGANFFIDLFRNKEKAEAEAKAKAEAKKVLADEIKAKDEEIKALKKMLAAKKSAAKATAKKKAAK